MGYRNVTVNQVPDHGTNMSISYPLYSSVAVTNQYRSYHTGNDDPLKRAENPYTAYGWLHAAYAQNADSYVGNRWTWYGYMCNSPADGSPVIDSFLPVWGKLQSMFQGHNLQAGVALAEGHKTVATVLGGLSRLTRSLNTLRKGNVVGALTALGVQTRDGGKSYDVRAGTKAHRSGRRRYRIKKDPKVDFAGTWLEMQYGWKPLLSDIEEAVNAYHARVSTTRSQTFRASKRQDVGFAPLVTLFGKWLKPPVISQDISGENPENSNTLAIKARISVPPTSAEDLGLYDPLSIAWELVPLSFVADWFIPIGNFLSSLSFAQRTTGVFSQKSLRKVTWRFKVSGARFLSSPGNPGSWFNFVHFDDYRLDGHSYRTWNFTRTASLPITAYTFLTSNSLPAFKPLVKAASVSHVVSAIALLRVAARS